MNHANVFPFGANQANFRSTDFFVGARAGVALRRRIMGSAGYDVYPSVTSEKCPENNGPGPAIQVNCGYDRAYRGFQGLFAPESVSKGLILRCADLGGPVMPDWQGLADATL
ncbi:hypothetical protein Q4598_16585 [Phaeobacter inhibens]|uniref:hypothetical protein n=1 Tax=Phaeobacter inhibens TaxID=221822 RepID=UPI000160D613|nr:hypothetical protein [Phaeobacter inhibens]MDO6757857.1 hypothetical protein [Phaeobacter inhibens]